MYEKIVSQHHQEMRSAAARESRARRTGGGSLLGLHGGRTAIASLMLRVTERAQVTRSQEATTRLKVSAALS
jgi:hypothetical protein